MDQPGIQIHLKYLHGFIQLLAEGDAEKLIQRGAVEEFHDAVYLRPAYLGLEVFDNVEI
jgi:hypothetical protein